MSQTHSDPHRTRSQTKSATKFSDLSIAEKWRWHASVYAFRHVVLGETWDADSPCDPQREWFDPNLVEKAIETKRTQFAYTPIDRSAKEAYAVLWNQAQAEDFGFKDAIEMQTYGRSYASVREHYRRISQALPPWESRV